MSSLCFVYFTLDAVYKLKSLFVLNFKFHEYDKTATGSDRELTMNIGLIAVNGALKCGLANA